MLDLDWVPIIGGIRWGCIEEISLEAGMILRRLLDKVPLWKRGNLLDEELIAEVHILIPSDGSAPRLFVPKQDRPTDAFVYGVTQAIVNAAMDHAKLYGVNVSGFLGQPQCPHCQKVITGPPEPPKT